MTPSPKKQILDTLRSYREEIVKFTKTLVSIPTENPPGRSCAECAAAIQGKLDEIGLAHEVAGVPTAARRAPALPAGGEAPPPRSCLLSGYGGGMRTVYFHGHYDVVPAANPWQFQPCVKGDNLFGRGSADMKGGLAAMIYAVKVIKEMRIGLGGKIGLVFVPDEETGGLGSRYLAGRRILGRDGIAMLTPEPTSGVIWNACRGAVSLRVTVRGRTAHVGLQSRGINAFERMLAVANALLELKRDVESRSTTFRITPKTAQSSILMLGGRCEGGTNFNAVPAECWFTVDRRINPEEDLGTEKRRLLEVFDYLKRDGIDLDVEVLQEGRSAGFSDKEPVARALAESVQAVTGRSPSFEMCPGLLEIRFYAEKGVPALAYGPGRLSVSHGPNEFVSVNEIISCAAVYALTACRLLADG